ncbi:MAG: helix-turn-helix domain-containing protein [Acidimicrobiales bacterium]
MTAPRADADAADGLRPHEAAAQLGVPAREVYRLLAVHQLSAYRDGGRLVIRRESVERFRARPRSS